MEIKTNKTIKHLTLLTLCTLALLQPELAGAMEKDDAVALINNFDKEIDDRLLAATKKGDINGVKDAIKDDANVNVANKNDWNRTPLHYATRDGHPEIVRLLIEKGATIDAQDNIKCTPLHFAAKKGHLEIVRLLIEKGATIDAKDIFDQTPLHYATIKDHLEVVRFLIEKGASINAKKKWDWTPLHLAAENGYLEVVKLLIEKGASINAQDDEQWAPCHYAAKEGHQEVVAYLTLAEDLLKAAKNPDTFDTFANTYLNLNDTKKARQNLADIIGILASRIAMMDKECIKKLFNWMKQHKRLLFKRNQDSGEIFDAKWFYLDLAYQTGMAAPHTKIALLKKCFDYLETTTNSVFNTAVQEYIERKGLWTCCDQNMYTKKQLEERQKTWDTLAKERSKMIDQKMLFACTALRIPKRVPSVDLNNITIKSDKNFRDITVKFEN